MTGDEVRQAIKAMGAYDHGEGRHDGVELPAGVCPLCDERGGHYENRAVRVCSRPEATTIVTRRVWVGGSR